MNKTHGRQGAGGGGADVVNDGIQTQTAAHTSGNGVRNQYNQHQNVTHLTQ